MSERKGGRRFQRVASPTTPNADEAVQDAPVPKRPDVQTSNPSRKHDRAFTWRLDLHQADLLDSLTLKLRRELGISRLDKATWLDALVHLADENPAMFGALVARLSDVQTSRRN
jgi:hypothetical protein